MNTSRRLPLLGALLIGSCAQLETAPNQPVELGLVHWERDYHQATERAQREERDVLLLFQEVPG